MLKNKLENMSLKNQYFDLDQLKKYVFPTKSFKG